MFAISSPDEFLVFHSSIAKKTCRFGAVSSTQHPLASESTTDLPLLRNRASAPEINPTFKLLKQKKQLLAVHLSK